MTKTAAKIDATLPLLKSPLKRMKPSPSSTWSWADVEGRTKDGAQPKLALDDSFDALENIAQRIAEGVSESQESRKGSDEVDHVMVATHDLGVDLVRDVPAVKKRGRPKKVDLALPVVVIPERPGFDKKGRIIDPLCGEIRDKHKIRQRWHRAEKALTLQARAFCRSLISEEDDAEHYDDKKLLALRIRQADALFKAVVDADDTHPRMREAWAVVMPFLEAKALIEKSRTAIEKDLERLAVKLPVAEFVRQTRGIGLGGLASIVGETGTLLNYATVAKVWKRCGVAVMPDGERQRRVAGNDAIDHKYSPSRRSVVWNVGSSLIGGMGRGKRPMVGEDITGRNDWSPLEKLFVERLRIEAEKDPTHARPPTADGKESYSKHAAARAKRYVEKRFLKELWREWRKMSGQPYGDDYTPE